MVCVVILITRPMKLRCGTSRFVQCGPGVCAERIGMCRNSHSNRGDTHCQEGISPTSLFAVLFHCFGRWQGEPSISLLSYVVRRYASFLLSILSMLLLWSGRFPEILSLSPRNHGADCFSRLWGNPLVLESKKKQVTQLFPRDTMSMYVERRCYRKLLCLCFLL